MRCESGYVVLALDVRRAVVPRVLDDIRALRVLQVRALGDLPPEAIRAARDELVSLAGSDVHRAANTRPLHRSRRQVGGRLEVVRGTAMKQTLWVNLTCYTYNLSFHIVHHCHLSNISSKSKI